MYSLLVLGLIPGTNIQINFELYVQSVLTLLLAAGLALLAVRYNVIAQSNVQKD